MKFNFKKFSKSNKVLFCLCIFAEIISLLALFSLHNVVFVLNAATFILIMYMINDDYKDEYYD